MAVLGYTCPDCRQDVEPCCPDGREQLVVSSTRSPKKSANDEFGGGYSQANGEPYFVCWNCNQAIPRSSCRVKNTQTAIDGQSRAAGERP